MDLGTYERTLDQNLTRLNFATSGQIFRRVLERERTGGYLGRDVQMIPHVTGEVKNRLRELAVATRGRRRLRRDRRHGRRRRERLLHRGHARSSPSRRASAACCFVALTYIIEPPILGEQKTKAAQLGIRRLLECGIQPHIIACRAQTPVDAQGAREDRHVLATCRRSASSACTTARAST